MNSNSIIENIGKERYFKNGEKTWNEVYRRVANAIMDNDEDRDEIYNLMVDDRFKPNSPCLMNAGMPNAFMSACIALGLEDDLPTIMKTFSNASILMKAGSGIGIDYSPLRPKGDMISNTNGGSSGVISFMSMFNKGVDVIQSGATRRGAEIGALDVTHPQIEEFIECKKNNHDLSNMNISVRATDDFMKCVENNKNYDLTFNNKVYKTVNARDIFNRIVDSAWSSAEPGLLFIDTILKNEPGECKKNEIGVNPCIYEDEYMFTSNGLEKIKNVTGNIFDGNKFCDSKVWKSGDKNTVKVTTKSGYEYIVTPDHKFMLEDGTWCEAKDLLNKKIKHKIEEREWNGVYNKDLDYEIVGFLFGDGAYHKASKGVKYAYFTPNKDDEVLNIFNQAFGDISYISSDNRLMMNIPNDNLYSNLYHDKIENRMLPDNILSLPKQQMGDFIRGLFSANGTNLKKYNKIQLVSINKNMLKQVQNMLSLFGIKAKLWVHNKQNDVKFSNGTYTCKESYHLVISRKSYKKYLDKIGFIQSYKNGYNEINFKDENNYEHVISVEDYGIKTVYDFSSPNTHYGMSNGAYLHNCGETILRTVPCGGESCNLGSINIAKYIEHGEIDYEELRHDVNICVKFLDNIIDKNVYPVKEVEEITKRFRRIGLGVMGWHDALIKMNVPYGSDNARRIAAALMTEIHDAAEEESYKLGEERGSYPAYDGDIPKRNHALTVLAPTGSLATISKCSYGIEPIFALAHSRTTWADGEPKTYAMIADIVSEVLEQISNDCPDINIENVKNEIMKTGSVQHIKDLPKKWRNILKTSMEISPKDHIKMQAAFQNNGVDNSISKTINMPRSATKQDVYDAYMFAWKSGCKGITVYRDGSRDSQVLSVPTKSEEYIKPTEIDHTRPIALPGTTYKKHSGCGKLFITVTERDGVPYEVFVQTAGSGGCQANSEALGRAISAGLRNGVPASIYVKQMSRVICPKCKDKRVDGKSCADIVGKCLTLGTVDGLTENEKRTMEDSIEQHKDAIELLGDDSPRCPECGAPINMIEGCMTCPSCGYSKCS